MQRQYMTQRPRCLEGHPAQTHSSWTLSVSASTAWAFSWRQSITPLKKRPFFTTNAHKTVSTFLAITLISFISCSKSQALSSPRMVTFIFFSLRAVITLFKLAICWSIWCFWADSRSNLRSRPCRRYFYDKGRKR